VDEKEFFRALFTLHRDMPRQGPGSDAATQQAISLLPALPTRPTVLDLGCGPGRQTLVLANELGTPITAVDFHQPYLDQLQASAEEQGLAHLVRPRLGDMMNLEDPPGSVDLVWAEGSIFIPGFGQGLRLWRPLLRPGGLVVASDAAWLVSDPPEEVRSFWEAEYPAIASAEENISRADAAGFEVLDHFSLPQAGWWGEYYDPLQERVELLRPQAANDPALAQMLDSAQKEMDICRRFGDAYSYIYFIMRRRKD